MCLQPRSFENIGKVEIACNEQFLLFPQSFLPICRVFHDPLVSLNFEGFDPQIFLNEPQYLFFTFFDSYEGGHCDPLNRKLKENPAYV